MKLRQALDKAQKMRDEISPPPPTTAGAPIPHILPPPVPSFEPGRPVGDWQAPVYSQSIQHKLDEATLLRNRCVCFQPDAKEVEHFKILRTKIQMLTKLKGQNTLMVTSTNESEGKTLTSINLAMTFAKTFSQTVMLVDADLKRQTVHRTLGIQSRSGLVDYLLYERDLKDLIIWPGIEQMTLISGARTAINSAELLSSPRMKALVEEMKTRYDDRFIIFDSAPVMAGADAMALAAHVDCVVMMVNDGRTSWQELKTALEMLPAEKMLGFVLNRQKKPMGKGYKYYGYKPYKLSKDA
jgi:non-specific protein-tyrosine kinase